MEVEPRPPSSVIRQANYYITGAGSLWVWALFFVLFLFVWLPHDHLSAVGYVHIQEIMQSFFMHI